MISRLRGHGGCRNKIWTPLRGFLHSADGKYRASLPLANRHSRWVLPQSLYLYEGRGGGSRQRWAVQSWVEPRTGVGERHNRSPQVLEFRMRNRDPGASWNGARQQGGCLHTEIEIKITG